MVEKQSDLMGAVSDDCPSLTKAQDLDIRNRVFFHCDNFLRQYAEKIDKIIDYIEQEETKKEIEVDITVEDVQNDMRP